MTRTISQGEPHFTYHVQGRRMDKAVGSGLGAQRTRVLAAGAQVLAEYSSTNALKARYVHGPGIDEPILMVRSGRFSYLHQDGLGSVTAATDARGVLVEAYRYRAFGEGTVLDAQGNLLAASRVGNPFRFTGRELDAETNLYYYRNRYYAQTMGRFLTPDPFPSSPTNPASWHRYSYVENNPINRLDPLGLRAEAAEIPDDRMGRLEEANQIPGPVAEFLGRVGFEETDRGFQRTFTEEREFVIERGAVFTNVARVRTDTRIDVEPTQGDLIVGRASQPIEFAKETTLFGKTVGGAEVSEITVRFVEEKRELSIVDVVINPGKYKESLAGRSIPLPTEEALQKYEDYLR